MRRRIRATWENRQFQWWIVAHAVLCVSILSDNGDNDNCCCVLCTDIFDMFGAWHLLRCRCAQCFRVFQDGIFYEFEGRKYCERDFHVLFAPCCNKCGEFVIGRVIKAMAANWHPHCFCCEMCHKELADCGFIRNQVNGRCGWVTTIIDFIIQEMTQLIHTHFVIHRIVHFAMIAMLKWRLSAWANTCATNASEY